MGNSKLGFINKDVVWVIVVFYGIFDESIKLVRISQLFLIFIIQSNSNDLFSRDTGSEQVSVKEIKKQKRFSAAPNTGNDFDHSIVHSIDQTIEICVPRYKHGSSLYKNAYL